MIIEVYFAGSNHPPLYDAYIDREGTLWGMQPPPPHDDTLMQVVLERAPPFPNQEQAQALAFLVTMNNGTLQSFFEGIP